MSIKYLKLELDYGMHDKLNMFRVSTIRNMKTFGTTIGPNIFKLNLEIKPNKSIFEILQHCISLLSMENILSFHGIAL